MPVSAKYYGNAFVAAFNKEIDYVDDTIKVALLGTGYTPDLDNHNYFDDVVANEIAAGSGYTAGGVTLTGKSIAYDGATNTFKIVGANATWSGATFSARYAVVYDATPATNAARPLISLVDFGATMSPSAGVLTVDWDDAGIATVTVA